MTNGRRILENTFAVTCITAATIEIGQFVHGVVLTLFDESTEKKDDKKSEAIEMRFPVFSEPGDSEIRYEFGVIATRKGGIQPNIDPATVGTIERKDIKIATNLEESSPKKNPFC